ncbi:unnamed protein product [Cylicocyclus nassatus]|uniref:Uncharacterized protein n=1 Tax=Cylicocyclus nassatus TaxID=53992 RepID=A0AA36GWJ6_CYLNA|nr:unnamed protein product [Cylicocyclus nassatus]
MSIRHPSRRKTLDFFRKHFRHHSFVEGESHVGKRNSPALEGNHGPEDVQPLMVDFESDTDLEEEDYEAGEGRKLDLGGGGGGGGDERARAKSRLRVTEADLLQEQYRLIQMSYCHISRCYIVVVDKLAHSNNPVMLLNMFRRVAEESTVAFHATVPIHGMERGILASNSRSPMVVLFSIYAQWLLIRMNYLLVTADHYLVMFIFSTPRRRLTEL